MDIVPTVEIDLAKYGLENEKIVMSEPDFDHYNTMQNQMNQCIRGMKLESNVRLESVMFGDLELIMVLGYVESGPFEQSIKSFKEFMRRVDAVRRGNGVKLYEEMKNLVVRLKGGEKSPLEN